jgi:hypothetical protein
MLLWIVALVLCVPGGLVPLQRLIGMDLRLDLLRQGTVPAGFHVDPWLVLAPPLAIAVWIAGNAWRWRAREA